MIQLKRIFFQFYPAKINCNITKLSITVIFLLLISSCSINQKLVVTDLDTPGYFKNKLVSTVIDINKQQSKKPWWELFNDVVLNQLMELTASNNISIAQTLAHYKELEFQLTGSYSEQWPVFSLGNLGVAKAGVNKKSTGLTFTASSGLSWKPDLWGKIRENAKISEKQLQQGLQQSRANIQNVQSLVAQQYFSIRSVDQNIDVQQQNLIEYAKAMQLTNDRYKQGTKARVDVIQSEIQLENAKTLLLDLQNQRKLAENYLAILVGVVPANWQLGKINVTPIVPKLVTDYSVKMLMQREDVLQAKYQIQIENSTLGIRKLDWLPDMSLSLNIGRNGESIKKLLSTGNAWSFGPQISWDILDFGRRDSKKHQAELALKQAILKYRENLIKAVGEAEDALLNYKYAIEQQQRQQHLFKLTTENSNIVMSRYKEGLVGYFEVIDAQNLLRNQQVSQLNAQLNIQKQIINLAKVFGGDL